MPTKVHANFPLPAGHDSIVQEGRFVSAVCCALSIAPQSGLKVGWDATMLPVGNAHVNKLAGIAGLASRPFGNAYPFVALAIVRACHGW